MHLLFHPPLSVEMTRAAINILSQSRRSYADEGVFVTWRRRLERIQIGGHACCEWTCGHEIVVMLYVNRFTRVGKRRRGRRVPMYRRKLGITHLGGVWTREGKLWGVMCDFKASRSTSGSVYAAWSVEIKTIPARQNSSLRSAKGPKLVNMVAVRL